ncbi:MAG: hypothetical protein HY744_19945 [Deltaproteobacteria bacterium]|nr:hypothetical protein [Deltaproteobacteria bacterium]
MSIDDLNVAVTGAIFRAEGFERDGNSAAAARAYVEVAQIEERLASALPPGEIDGNAAREGAVRAWLKARDPRRAIELAAGYLREALPRNTRGEIEKLELMAKTQLNPLVVPAARFRFARAA